MAQAVVQSGLNLFATKMYDYLTDSGVSNQGSAGPCEDDGNYIGVAGAGYPFSWISPSGDTVSANLSTNVETVIKSDDTYSFRKLEIRGRHASSFDSGLLLLTLANNDDIDFEFGGKIILETLSIEFSL